jgi:hypothetical protein
MMVDLPEKKFGISVEGSLNHALSLTLELLEQDACGFRFRVTACNDSAAKLFLPLPEIIGLRFWNTATCQEGQWYTHTLVSADGGGFTLNPRESSSDDWRVRPCSVKPAPEVPGDYSDRVYRRWCVGLESGTYLVWYKWRVGNDYFDPDSHMRLPDLEYAAEREGAAVWLGQVLSNIVQVDHA